jgi:hypothetical protein
MSLPNKETLDSMYMTAVITLLGRSVPYVHFNEPWILQRRLAAHVIAVLGVLRKLQTTKSICLKASKDWGS